MECKNNQSNSNSLSSSYFNAYADDVALNSDIIVINEPDGFHERGSVGSNQRIRLVVIFEASPGWKELELNYKSNMFLSRIDAKFKVNASEVSEEGESYSGNPFGDYSWDEEGLTPAGTVLTTKEWEIKLVGAKKYRTIGEGYLTQTPSAGNMFVAMFFEVTNISSKEDRFSSLAFDGFEDGYAIYNATAFVDIDGYKSLSGDVAPGKKLTGFILFEVKEDFSCLEATYDYMLDKTVKFTLTSDMVD